MNKICTSLEQSKKLIELGIDVNTADMRYGYIAPYDFSDSIDELEKKIDNLQYQVEDVLCDINIVNENVFNTYGLLSRKKIRNEEVK